MLNVLGKIAVAIIIIVVANHLINVSKDRAICENYCLQNDYDDYGFSPKYNSRYQSVSIATCTCKRDNGLPDIFSLDEIKNKNN